MFSFKNIFRHIWPHINKYKFSFYLLFFTQTVRVFTSVLLPPIILKNILDLLSNGGDRMQNSAVLFHYIFLLSAVIILGYFMNRITGSATTYFQSNVMRDLHNYAFEKLTKHSYNFFTNQFAGGLVAKTKRFVRGFETMHDLLIFEFYVTFLSVVGIFYVLFREVPKIAVAFMIWAVVYVIFTLFFVKYKMKYDLLEAEADSKVGGSLADVISNIVTMKIFSARSSEIDRYKEVTEDEKKHRSNAWYWGNIQDAAQGVFMVSINISILYMLAHSWVDGLVTAGVFVLVQSYMVNLFDKLWGIVKAMTKFVKASTDMKEVTDIFDQVPEILDPEKPEKLKIKNGHIEFKDVCFEYIEDREVFSNFNLDIKSGERIGLVGHSGSGKSTITKLLLRFSDVTKGSILIDGQDIKNIKQDDLRSAISYVPQEPILFHRTIKENIAYANPKAKNKEIVEAAKQAHAHDFISNLQYGYDTLVGERGVKLSGGERQRVAIARAMLKHAPVLILDEATSSLDSISEQYIQEAFNKLMEGKTTIVIAHRLSTIQKMDRIIVLEGGKIAEEGSHTDLIDKNGKYAELWNHQVGGFIE
ncbi:MAG: ABC transporter ATP-binding protein [Candidatus Nomurabacteria bacterium]|nr:ABC transporter ATP-binding protein [Candidatus Nomurabacteria bacterium]